MFTDQEIDEIGFMLEEKGLSHSQIDSYFEHHGVRGMKWGQRHAKKVAKRKAVAAKKQKDVQEAQRVAMKTAHNREEAIAITNKILKEKGYHVFVEKPKPVRGRANKYVVNNVIQKTLSS